MYLTDNSIKSPLNHIALLVYNKIKYYTKLIHASQGKGFNVQPKLGMSAANPSFLLSIQVLSVQPPEVDF